MKTDHPKILLVGTSYSAIPLLFALKKHQLHISVTGCLPSDPCHLYADRSYSIDFSKKQDLLDLIRTEKFDYILPSCNDFSYLSCAWAAEALDLPGFDPYETVKILHTKHAFREFTEKYGFPIPKAWPTDSPTPVDVNSNRPLLVKPVDAFSGRGITKIQDQADIEPAVLLAQKYSRSNRAIIEEFVNGSLHSHSAFIQDKKILFDVFVDEYCSVYPYQVNCSNIPSRLPEKITHAVRACMLELVNILQLTDGLLHTQFITNDKDFWLIECMRRCPGDLYGRLIELSQGVAYTDLYIAPFIDKKSVVPPAKSSKLFARHTFSVPVQQLFTSFTLNIPTQNIQIFPLKNSGETFDIAPYDKSGILFAEFNSLKTLFEITPKLASYVHFDNFGE